MSLLTFALVAMHGGVLCGFIAAMLALRKENWQANAISTFICVAVIFSALAVGYIALFALLTLVTGWLSAWLILAKIEDGYFEETSIAAALFVVVVPPVLVCLGWLFVFIVGGVLQLFETPVSITVVAHPALKQWALGIAFGVWGSAIGAFPPAYLEARSDVMARLRHH